MPPANSAHEWPDDRLRRVIDVSTSKRLTPEDVTEYIVRGTYQNFGPMFVQRLIPRKLF